MVPLKWLNNNDNMNSATLSFVFTVAGYKIVYWLVYLLPASYEGTH